MPYISIYVWRVSEVHGDIKQRKVACYQQKDDSRGHVVNRRRKSGALFLFFFF